MPKWIRLSVPFVVAGPAIDDHAFIVLDHLHDLDDIVDPDVYIDLSESLVTLELITKGTSDLDAVRNGLAAMRTAIHTAGGTTHGWEDDFADVSDLTPFPIDAPTTEWEPTETKFTSVLIDA